MTFLSDWLKNKFGTKVYKLSLSTGCTCPNRDGTKGYGGCSFCSEGGSGEFAEKDDPVDVQIENAKKRVSSKFPKNGPRKYIAYFQSFSNTHVTPRTSVEFLEKKFMEAAFHPDVVTVSIGTRPDCITPEIVAVLKKVSEIKPVWVELGLQTVHEETGKRINRCCTLFEFLNSYRLLSDAGIPVVVHLIIGLPGETEEMMVESARFVAQLDPPVFGIKFHNLQVLKGTETGRQFLENPFKIFSLEEYGEILSKCLSEFGKDVVVHRITGDGPKSLLIEPKWSADKKKVMNYLKKLPIMNS